MQAEREQAAKEREAKDAELRKIEFSMQAERERAKLEATAKFAELASAVLALSNEKEKTQREEQERGAAIKAEQEKLAAAPDNEKLEALRLEIVNITLPDFATEKARETGANVLKLLWKISAFIQEKKS